jgi:hypothetical protein
MSDTGSLSFPNQCRCRQIERSDFDAVTALLTRGFPNRPDSYWHRVLSRLETRHTPPDYPKYGYLLENEDAAVGVILLIFTAVAEGGEPSPRCYLSSWYVEPVFRSYASLLVSAATKRREVTYVNLSPDPRTWPIIEAQGFSRYSRGQYRAILLLSLWSESGHVREMRTKDRTQAPVGAKIANLLSDHAEYGCLSLFCDAADGQHPFVFQVQRIGRGFVPCAQLIYCQDVADLARFARPLGLFLLRRGILFVSLDSNGQVKGLAGTYSDGKAPKYCKGPHPPRQGDVAYTEAVLFGM